MKKIGIIGCGRISHKHIAAIKNNKNKFRIVSVCDTNYDKASKIAKIINVNAYPNIKLMMKNEIIDLVVILTENGNHTKHYLEVSSFKKDCVIEKPLALTLRDAKKIRDVAAIIKKKIFIVKQNRFNPAVEYFNQLNKKKIFGKLFLGNATVRWRRDQSYFDLASWRGTRKLDGGVIGNQASHHLDLLIWSLGKVKEVHAIGSNYLVKNIESEDTVLVNLKFSDDKMASIEATTATSPENIEGSISFLGTKGTIVIGGFAMNKLEYCKSEKASKLLKKKFDTEPPNVYGFGHDKFYKYLDKIFNNKKLIKKNIDLAVHVSEVIEAINKSIQLNKIIKIKK